MPTLSSIKIPPPKSWEEFEEITLDACKLRWENPDLQMHGRRGQKQDGVDIFGANHVFSSVGVQCKNYKEPPSLELVHKEIVNAEKFKPGIGILYIAVSSETDAKIQKEIRQLSLERTIKGDFPIMMLFWNDIIQDLARNSNVLRKHYPQFSIDEFQTPSEDKKLFSIYDLAYNGLNLDYYLELVFGEIGTMVGENPLQIKSLIHTIKFSASNVMDDNLYHDFEMVCNNLKDYLFPKDGFGTDFNWDVPLNLSNEIISTVSGVQYNLNTKERIVYNIAKTLVNWAQWEIKSNDEPYGDASWLKLRELIAKLEIDNLNQRLLEIEKQYNELKGVYRSGFPHKVYNAVRQELIYLGDK